MIETISFIFSTISILIAALIFYYNFIKRSKPVIHTPNRFGLECVKYEENGYSYWNLILPIIIDNKSAHSIVIDRISAIVKQDNWTSYYQWQWELEYNFSTSGTNISSKISMPFTLDKYCSQFKLCHMIPEDPAKLLSAEIYSIDIILHYNKNKTKTFKWNIILDGDAINNAIEGDTPFPINDSKDTYIW